MLPAYAAKCRGVLQRGQLTKSYLQRAHVWAAYLKQAAVNKLQVMCREQLTRHSCACRCAKAWQGTKGTQIIVKVRVEVVGIQAGDGCRHDS